MKSRNKTERRASVSAAAPELPLLALLSHALVAFAIEFDNEAEHRMRHRTTRHDSAGSADGSLHGPWLVSLVMWSNCMQFVGDKGVRVGELEKLARTKTNLNGMERWGYVVVEPDPADKRTKPPRSDWVIRATRAGSAAREVWEAALRHDRKALGGTLRGGHDRAAARIVAGAGRAKRREGRAAGLSADPGLRALEQAGRQAARTARTRARWRSEAAAGGAAGARAAGIRDRVRARVGLVARDQRQRGANPRRERRARAGPSAPQRRVKGGDQHGDGRSAEEAHGCVEGDSQPRENRSPDGGGPRGSGCVPSNCSASSKNAGRHALARTQSARYAESLERLAGGGTAETSPLFGGLEPYPDGWRASVRKPETLPHYPMVLHRGGFPDGS